jgi:hypothetical protein
LDRLRAAIAERGSSAYLLTVSDDGRPHAVHVPVAWLGDRLTAEVGKRSAGNAAARPAVSLLFAVRAADDYSLIVDGVVDAPVRDGGQQLFITPTKAVLHRPATAPNPSSGCDADCVPVLPSTSRRGS